MSGEREISQLDGYRGEVCPCVLHTCAAGARLIKEIQGQLRCVIFTLESGGTGGFIGYTLRLMIEELAEKAAGDKYLQKLRPGPPWRR